MAGKIMYLAPIDGASGKIFGKQTQFTAVRRHKGNTINGCRMHVSSTKAPSADMLTQRAIFKAASDYTKNIMLDSTKRKAAEQRFKNATGAYSKYTTLRTFLMGESFNGDEVQA